MYSCRIINSKHRYLHYLPDKRTNYCPQGILPLLRGWKEPLQQHPAGGPTTWEGLSNNIKGAMGNHRIHIYDKDTDQSDTSILWEDKRWNFDISWYTISQSKFRYLSQLFSLKWRSFSLAVCLASITYTSARRKLGMICVLDSLKF